MSNLIFLLKNVKILCIHNLVERNAMRRSSFYSTHAIDILFICFCALILAVAIGFNIAGNSNEQTYVATVTDKDIKNYDKTSKYLIFTKTDDGETRVFSVEDSILRWRFNSSDVYAEIEVGKTYRFTTVGFRFEPFSWYENIIDYQEISNDSAADARQLE